MWNFQNIPERLRNKVVNEWRACNKKYVIAVIKEHNVFFGDCDNCLRDQLKEWITYEIEEPDGALFGYGDKYKSQK